MRSIALWLIGTLAAAGMVAAAPTTPAAPSVKPAAPAKAAKTGLVGGQADESNLPYDITSENSDYDKQARRQIWSGNVEAIRGTSRMRTPRLTAIFAARDPGAPKAGPDSADVGKIERMEAEGPVYYVNPTQKAKGDHATYLAADDTITMTGNVVLVENDKNTSIGDKLVIDRKSEHYVLSVNPAPADNAGPKHRVRMVLYPSNNTTGPANGTGPAQPPKPAGKP